MLTNNLLELHSGLSKVVSLFMLWEKICPSTTTTTMAAMKTALLRKMVSFEVFLCMSHYFLALDIQTVHRMGLPLAYLYVG